MPLKDVEEKLTNFVLALSKGITKYVGAVLPQRQRDPALRC